MNEIPKLFRAIIIVYLFTSCLQVLSTADPTTQVSFQLTFARSTHGLTLWQLDAENQPVQRSFTHSGIHYVYGEGVDENGNPVATQDPYCDLWLGEVDPQGGIWWLHDSAANEVSPANTPGLLSYEWHSLDGPLRRFFSLPAERYGHTFYLAQRSAVDVVTYTTLATGEVHGWINDYGSTEPFNFFEGWALALPDTVEFWIVDAGAYEKSPSNSYGLTSASWIHDSHLVPWRMLNIYLTHWEVGYHYTLHTQLPGGPEILTNVIPQRVEASGDFANWDGSNRSIDSNDSIIQTATMEGAGWWITRNVDNVTVWCPGANCENYDLRLDFPARERAQVEFYVRKDTRLGHDFWVKHPFATFSTSVPSTNEQWEHTNSQTGQIEFFLYMLVTADIDCGPAPDNAFHLFDATTGESFPAGQTTIWDNFQWDTMPAPQYITLDVLNSQSANIELVDIGPNWDTYYSYAAGSGTQTSQRVDNVWDDREFSVECRTVTVDYYAHHFQPNWMIVENHATFRPVLGNWQSNLPLPTSQFLSISTSRWGHDLRIRQPHTLAEQFVVQHGTVGDWYQDWQTSYYYFEADGSVVPGLPYWIYDATTGENSPVLTSNLVEWISTPTPVGLSAISEPTGLPSVTITWNPGVGSPGSGEFILERFTRNIGWVPVAMPSNSPARYWNGVNTTISYVDEFDPAPIRPHLYRVSFRFGSQVSPPCEPLNCDFDTDGDGIPDNWERDAGLDPLNPYDSTFLVPGAQHNALDIYQSGGIADLDEDGMLDAWERAWGLNPRSRSDANLKVGGVGSTAKELYDQKSTLPAAPPVWAEGRYRLYQVDAYDANGIQIGYHLTWDGPLVQGRTLVFQVEIEDDNWEYAGSAPSVDQYYLLPMPNVSPSRREIIDLKGTGSCDPYNHRISGAYTSNESVMQLRLHFTKAFVNTGWPQTGFTTNLRRTAGSSTSFGVTETASWQFTGTEWKVEKRQGENHSSETCPARPNRDGTVSTTTTIGGNTSTTVVTHPPTDTSDIHGVHRFMSVASASGERLFDGSCASDDTCGGGDSSVSVSGAYPMIDFVSDSINLHEALKLELSQATYGDTTFSMSFGNARSERYWISCHTSTAIFLAEFFASASYGVKGADAEWWIECNDCLVDAPRVFQESDMVEWVGAPYPSNANPKPELATLVLVPGATPGVAQRMPANGGIRSTMREMSTHFPDTIYPTMDASSRSGPGDLLVAEAKRFVNVQAMPHLGVFIDTNRDGSLNPNDRNTVDTSFRFWVNNDTDNNDDDTWSPLFDNPWTAKNPDNGPNQIYYTEKKRDLDDLIRFHVGCGDLKSKLASGEITAEIGFRRFLNSKPVPRLNFYKAADPSMNYLQDLGVGALQSTNPLNIRIVRDPSNNNLPSLMGGVANTCPLAQSLWQAANLPPTNAIVPFLMEGIKEGEAELVLILKQHGNIIGEIGGTFVQIDHIGNMYQRFKLADSFHPDAPAVDVPATPNFVVNEFNPMAFRTSWDQTSNYLVYVHGWRQDDTLALSEGLTLYKRLWHQGFKGKFVTFHWPTLLDGLSFNKSEYRAWKCGVPFRDFIANQLTGGYVDVIAHSLGNVVVSSSLDKGAVIRRYLLLNAAIPAFCFDPNPALVQSGKPATYKFQDYFVFHEPDLSFDPVLGAGLGYKQCISTKGSAVLVNFYMTEDIATTHNWEANQWAKSAFAIDLIGGGKPADGYKYLRANSIKFKSRVVNDRHEAMSMVERSRTKAVGAEPNTGGMINFPESIILYIYDPTKAYTNIHSAEFELLPQRTWELYKKMNQYLTKPTLP